MRYKNLTRTAILGTSAALCFAVAGPASAHSVSSDNRPATKTTATKAPTLAQQKAWIDAFIAKRQQGIDSYAAKAAADPKLTTAQKADLAAKLAKQRAALNTLKTAVDSATTTDGLHQAVKTAMATDGVHGYFGWCGFYGASRHDPTKTHTTAHTRTTRDSKAKTDPGKATAPSTTVHTVSVRSGQSSVKAGQPAHAARHSDGRGSSSHGNYQGRHSGGDSNGTSHYNGGTHHH